MRFQAKESLSIFAQALSKYSHFYGIHLFDKLVKTSITVMVELTRIP
jgi:hypothetical protein